MNLVIQIAFFSLFNLADSKNVHGTGKRDDAKIMRIAKTANELTGKGEAAYLIDS